MASKGHSLCGYDPDQKLVEGLQKNSLPIHEPDLDGLFAATRERIQFHSTPHDLAGCDIVFVARDVATDQTDNSDLSLLDQIIDEVLAVVPAKVPVVLLSQVHPGYTRRLLEKRSNIFYQVETLIFGRAVERGLYPERYILGCKSPSEPLPEAYRALLDSYGCPTLKMRYESAELAKIAINFYLVSSVSTTNTLAEVCEQIGADWNEIAPSLRLDKRIGQHAYLTPGLGIAGGNLERDLITVNKIAGDKGTDNGVVASWIQNSRYRKDWAVRVLHQEFYAKGGAKSSSVALWGLAYKQDTKSTKNSPALHFAEGAAGTPVRAFDPQVELTPELRTRLGSEFKQVGAALDACDGADVLVILTPWQEFTKITPSAIAARMRGKIVIDPMGMLDSSACQNAGLKQIRMGVGEQNV